jgi:hypothetical protein
MVTSSFDGGRENWRSSSVDVLVVLELWFGEVEIAAEVGKSTQLLDHLPA